MERACFSIARTGPGNSILLAATLGTLKGLMLETRVRHGEGEGLVSPVGLPTDSSGTCLNSSYSVVSLLKFLIFSKSILRTTILGSLPTQPVSLSCSHHTACPHQSRDWYPAMWFQLCAAVSSWIPSFLLSPLVLSWSALYIYRSTCECLVTVPIYEKGVP